MRSADVISHCKIREVLKDFCSKCYFILVFSTVTYNRERPKTLKGHLVLVQKSIRNIPVLNKGWDLRCGSIKFFTTAHLDQKGGDYSPSHTYTWISGVHQCSYFIGSKSLNNSPCINKKLCCSKVTEKTFIMSQKTYISNKLCSF